MTKPARVTPKGALIKQLIADAGHSPEAFANEASISVKLLRQAILGKPCTPKTIGAIAEHLAKRLNRDVTFEELIERTRGQRSDAPKAEDLVPLLNVDFRITIAAHPSVLEKVSLDTLEASFKQAVSEKARFVLEQIRDTHSLYAICTVDSVGRDDLVQSFCYGRLQYLGAMWVDFNAPEGYDRDLAAFFLDRYYFAEEDIQRRFESRLHEGHGLTVATPNGLVTFTHSQMLADDPRFPQHGWHCSSTLSPSHCMAAERFWNHGGVPFYLDSSVRFQTSRIPYSGDLRPQLPAVIIEEEFTTEPSQEHAPV